MEGPEQDQHDAGGEIAERALQGKTDGDAERAQHGHEARGGDAEGGEHGDESEDQRGVARAVGEEERHGGSMRGAFWHNRTTAE